MRLSLPNQEIIQFDIIAHHNLNLQNQQILLLDIVILQVLLQEYNLKWIQARYKADQFHCTE